MVSVKISGDAIEVVGKILDKLQNSQPMLGRMAAYQERSTKLNFARQSDPDGKAWAPLSTRTLQRKRSGSILRETSALVNSVSSQVAGNSAIISAGQSYGIFHQTGTSKMPQRRFLGFGDRDIEEHQKIAREFFEL